MSIFDFKNNSTIETVTAPGAQTGTVTSAEVDRVDFNAFTFGWIQGVADLGVGTIKIQHSDVSGSGFVDAGSDDVLGTQDQAFLANANSDIGYVGSKRYIRAVVTLSTPGDGAIICIKSSPNTAPVA